MPVAALGIVMEGAITPSGRPRLRSMGASSRGLESTWIRVAVLLVEPRLCKAKFSRPSPSSSERSPVLIGSLTSSLKPP
jgi:hypothetical protein